MNAAIKVQRRALSLRLFPRHLRHSVDPWLGTAGRREGYPNLTVKKIPRAVLSRCEWGHDDYPLPVENLPKAPPPKGQQELFGEEVAL